jgi:hypothetical protein
MVEAECGQVDGHAAERVAQVVQRLVTRQTKAGAHSKCRGLRATPAE